jgi:hypothetical protein
MQRLSGYIRERPLPFVFGFHTPKLLRELSRRYRVFTPNGGQDQRLSFGT